MPMFTKSKTKAKKGFTLIELLVVISIIGLLSTLAVVALNNARVRSRDAARLANIQQLQTAMQLYYDANGTWDFPTGSTCGNSVATTGTAAQIYQNCLGTGTAGLGDQMQVSVLKDPTTNATASCPGWDTTGNAPGTRPAAGCQAAFINNVPSATAFEIGFCLEGSSTNLAAGCHTLNQTGIR